MLFSSKLAAWPRLLRFWADLPLRAKGLVVIAIPSAGLVLALSSFYYFQSADRQADSLVNDTVATLGGIQDSLTGLLDQECALHLYALTGSAARISPSGSAAVGPDPNVTELATRLREEPDQLARLDRIRRLRESLYKIRSEMLSTLNGNALAQGARLALFVKFDTGMEMLRAELGALRTRQEQLLAIRNTNVTRLRGGKLVVIACDALVGLAGGLIAILLFTAGITGRVERLRRNAALLERRLPLPSCKTGGDELGALDSALVNASVNLRRSEEERDRFFTISRDLLGITTLDGRFVRVNPACTRILGFPEAELLATGILELVHRADRQATERQIEELKKGNPVAYGEARFRCAEGSYKWLAWSSAPFEAEGVAYLIARDRTKLKLDEQALRQSNARLVTVLESITEGFFSVDCAWRIVFVNPQAERLWNRNRQEVLDRCLWEVFPEGVNGPFYRLYHEVMNSGIPGHLEDFCTPLGRWVEVHAYPSPDGLSVYFRDITERRQSQEHITRALKEKEVLLREVHHRVKNNLQIICSMLRLQERHLNDETLLQVLKECRERVLAMAMLHDQLHRAKDFSSINLGEYIRNLTASTFCSYGVTSAQIALDMNVEDLTVAIDTAIPCGLIVSELLSNSLKHAFPRKRKGRITVGLRGGPGGLAELTVCDDGCGFAESAQPFSTRSLGLRLVDLLAEQMEANVERSSLAGTQFRFKFQVKRLRETA
jgi:PAS domain S-box-containing protein